ncbi:hypothetical protein G4B88_030992 [Cannabis sativa]|uniref:Uncharacterized protein n=2 Tax=Cannabis sativa TaxID=3483 RepID=A0A7J6ENU0_CANSA|nr:hypothetical protein G4B88_005231 [Cannabis sativa]KAF4384096.1 hypothetical protein G4B88_030992 [Cannabis sativa]
MASVLRCSAEANNDVANMEFDEDDLFEIDLEAVDSIPPPRYWESCVTATESALLANCLLPISDLSSAVPMVSGACSAVSLARTGNVLMIMEPIPLGKLLQLSCLGTFGIQQKDMKA